MPTESAAHGSERGVRSLVFMFSGQGSQYYDMGRELFEQQPTFRRWMLRCNEIVEPVIGRSVLNVLYESGHRRSDLFTETVYTHPALFMIQWSLAQALVQNGIRPTLLLGYSIGELVAAAFAGVLSLEDALLVVVDQARLLARHCPPGSMAAILQPLEIRDRFTGLFEGCEVAAINYPKHFVVAGAPAAVQRLRTGLTAAGVVCEILPIRFAFHSTLMDPAEHAFKTRVAEVALHPSQMTIVSSASGDVAPVAGPDYFWDIVRRPVRFDRALAVLEKSGPHTYVDVGPSGTLANFVKYSLGASSRSVVAPGLTPFGGDLNALSRLERAAGREPDVSGAAS